jgi:hypothetical protein
MKFNLYLLIELSLVILIVFLTYIAGYFFGSHKTLSKNKTESILLPTTQERCLSLAKKFGEQMNGESGLTITTQPTKIKLIDLPEAIQEPFDPWKPPDGRFFYTIPANSYPWEKASFDVDDDDEPEDIMYANLAMNHLPHLLKIVKDGNVIFTSEGANIEAIFVGGNGFILNTTIDWIQRLKKSTKYIYKDGAFIPLYEQFICTIE